MNKESGNNSTRIFSQKIVAGVLAIAAVLVLGWYVSSVTTAAWYSNGGGGTWDHRVKITIDSAQVDSNLTDFPVYVDLSDLPSDFFSDVQSDGSDIRVTKADGSTELAREVVSVDTASSTGELHLKADSLSSSTDTEFYIYYGNSSASSYAASDTYGAENVWTNGYAGVWHLANIFSGTTNLSEQQIGVQAVSGGYYTGTYGLQFATTGDITLTTATIDAESTGSTTFELYKFDDGTENPSNGTLVDSVELTNLSAGENQVTLNLDTNGPGTYWVGRTDSFSLMRTDAGQSFPFESSPDGVTFSNGRDFGGSGTADRWYYLYDLNIEGEVQELNPAIDSTASSDDGTLQGSTEEATGRLGSGAVSFATEADSIQVPDSSSFDFPGGVYTVSAWVNPTSLSDNQAIVDTHDSSGNPLRFYATNGDGTVKIQNDSGFNDPGPTTPSGTLTTGSWSHISAVVDGTSASLYDGGSQVSSSSVSAYEAITDNLSFGNHPENSGSSMSAFDGALDEIRLASTTRSSSWISAEYTNQNTPTTFYSVGSQETDSGGTTFGDNMDGDWGDLDWAYREKITISASEVDSNLTNFPVYVDLSDLSTDFHSNVASDGADIRITAGDGTTELAREVVSVDTGSQAGELHFKADSLSSTSDTDFYIYYGNGSATNYTTGQTYGRDAVWSNYEAVYHMNEDPSGGSGAIVDSTGNGYDASANGSMTSGDLVASTMGQGLDFDGSDDYLSISPISLSGDWTVSSWLNVVDVSDGVALAGDDDTYDAIKVEQYNNTGNVGITDVDNGGDLDYGYATPYGTEAHIVWSNDNSATENDILHNGASAGNTLSRSVAMDIAEIANTNVVGTGGSNSDWLDGVIDELRFSLSKLSADWISAEYTNQNTPTTFYTAGGQEEQTSLPTVTTQAASSIATSSATGNGEIADTGGEDADARGFVWDTSSQSDPGDTAPGSSSYANNVDETGSFGTGTFTGSLTGLSADTTYYVRSFAHNSAGYSYGDEVSFTTETDGGGGGVTVGNTSTGNISSGSTLTINHSKDSASNVAFVSVIAGSGMSLSVTYGGTPMTSVAVSEDANVEELFVLVNPPAGSQDVEVTKSASINQMSAVVFDMANVDTSDPVGDTDTYGSGSPEGSFSATVSGSGPVIGAYGIQFPDSGQITYTAGFTEVDAGGTQSVYKSYVAFHDEAGSTQQWGASYTEDGYWTALAARVNEAPTITTPTVTTSAASSIATSSATGNGEIADTGGEDADARGFVWDTSSQSDPGDTAPGSSSYANNVDETGSFGTGTFTGSLTGLSADTTYYVRSFAHNSAGYSYGDEVSFTTEASSLTTITSIIKQDGTGDYTSISAWEAATDGDLVADNEIHVGQIADTATYNEQVTIAGATTSASNYRKLTVDPSVRHDGTAGSGPVINPSSSGHVFTIDEDHFKAEWLEVTDWEGGSSEAFRVNGDEFTLNHSILHSSTVEDADGVYIGSNGITAHVHNSIFYRLGRTSIHIQDRQNVTVNVNNVTVYNMTLNPSGTYAAIGFTPQAYADQTGSVMTLKNVTAQGSMYDFSENNQGGSFGTSDYNASSDTTAPGSNSLTGVTQSDQFVSVSSGSEDLHLKDGASLIDVGTSLGSDFQTDIDGETRSGSWDIGADQFVASGGGSGSGVIEIRGGEFRGGVEFR